MDVRIKDVTCEGLGQCELTPGLLEQKCDQVPAYIFFSFISLNKSVVFFFPPFYKNMFSTSRKSHNPKAHTATVSLIQKQCFFVPLNASVYVYIYCMLFS